MNQKYTVGDYLLDCLSKLGIRICLAYLAVYKTLLI